MRTVRMLLVAELDIGNQPGNINEAAQACETLGRTDSVKHYREAAEAAGKTE